MGVLVKILYWETWGPRKAAILAMEFKCVGRW